MFLNTLNRLQSEKLSHAPSWLPSNICYAAQIGSVAYGCSQDDSDIDVQGFCFPPIGLVFPHTSGEVPGFGTQIQRFQQWQQHHIKDGSEKEYDITIYSIVRFFHLCMENNPNMLDVLFAPRRCILHSTAVSELVRENRRLFLHKGSIPRLRGYSYSQLSKIENHNSARNPKRAADISRIGYDAKFLLHAVRLCLQAEQIMVEHDLDIERNSEILKSIRRGEWTLQQGREWFFAKEKSLEELYAKSTLRGIADEAAIKSLLLKCMEHHYGCLDKVVAMTGRSDALWTELHIA